MSNQTPNSVKTAHDYEKEDLTISVIQAAKETAVSYHNDNFDKRLALFKEISKTTFNEEVFTNYISTFSDLVNCRATNLQSLAYDGCLPIHAAAWYDNRRAIELLLTHGASAWSIDLRGRTPIHIAAEKGFDESCRILKEAMQRERLIDPIGPLAPIDLAGMTPLGGAVYKNHPTPKVKSLLFSPGDRTILPHTPKSKRTGKSPWKTNKSNLRTKGSYVYGFSEIKGWSKVNEDRALTIPSLSSHSQYGLFGVFDGHGGSFCSEYLKNNLSNIVSSQLDIHLSSTSNIEESLVAVLKKSCELIEKELREIPKLTVTRPKTAAGKLKAADTSGSTAIICLISTTHFAIANIGDSRAVLGSTRESTCECIPLSFDHKLNVLSEKERVEATGANVSQVGDNSDVYEVIVKGCDERLRMSRSFGDFLFKSNDELSWDKQAVIAIPDIIIRERTNNDEFIVLACDGIWDVMSNSDVVAFVHNHLIKPITHSSVVDVCDALIHETLDRNSHDNLTAIIIAFEDDSILNRVIDDDIADQVNRKLNLDSI
eukprot:gene17718-23310_t